MKLFLNKSILLVTILKTKVDNKAGWSSFKRNCLLVWVAQIRRNPFLFLQKRKRVRFATKEKVEASKTEKWNCQRTPYSAVRIPTRKIFNTRNKTNRFEADHNKHSTSLRLNTPDKSGKNTPKFFLTRKFLGCQLVDIHRRFEGS